jgi:flagellar basal body rod protein FlgC
MSSIDAIATSGLIAAQTDLAVAASNIANTGVDGAPPTPAPFGSSAVAAPPLSGTQPGGAAGQVFTALSATNTTTAGGGVSTTVTTQGGAPDLGNIQDVLALNAASTAYQANLTTLESGQKLTKQALNLIA